MIAVLAYLVATIAAGSFMSFLAIMLRSTKTRGDGSPYGTIAFWLGLCVFGPFLLCEAFTTYAGAEVESAIKKAYDDAPISGPMQYYRLTKLGKTEARALVIGKERENWGGTDRPVLSVTLVYEDGRWKPLTYKVLRSTRLNRDELVIPPYR